MNKGDLAEAIAQETGYTKTECAKLIDAVFDKISDALSKDGKAQFTGFGTFTVRTRSARTGMNPITKKVMEIPESKNVSFKAGKKLKEAVN